MTERDDVAAARLASDRGQGPPLPYLCPCGKHFYDHSPKEIMSGWCQALIAAEGKERSDP